MALKGGIAGVVILSVILLSSCAAYRLNNEETDREYLKRELDELEYEMAVKKLYSELKVDLLSNDIAAEITTKPVSTTVPPTTPKSSIDPYYVQHIVNCFKSYRYVTERGLSERDDIYNIVVVQCMSDPKVDRIIKILTAYYELSDEYEGTGYNVYDVVEWMFSIFKDDQNGSDEDDEISGTDAGTDVKEEETVTIAALNPTTPARDPTTPEPEATTAEHEPTTSVPKQTTSVPMRTTAEIQQTTEKVAAEAVTTSSSSNQINGEDNDEEAVKELLLQRIIMLLKEEKRDGNPVIKGKK